MDKIRIIGGKPLTGTVNISGAKNAALPLIVASLLTDQKISLSNCPDLLDINSLLNLLTELGVECDWRNDIVNLQAKKISNTKAPYNLVRKMRASIWVLGPLLVREKQAEVSLPGGCVIGARPINLHLDGLQKMGANIALENGYVKAKAPKGLHGARIRLPIVSVGATINLLLAATLAKGTTEIINAAVEPEIGDLIKLLISMGAQISGVDSNHLTIEGVNTLKAASHKVLPDRIEAGSYAIAAAITNSNICLDNINIDLLPSFDLALKNANINFTQQNNKLYIQAQEVVIKANDITTRPYPDYPTDLQAQYVALMTIARGNSKITETIFENRFMHVAELVRMGANIMLKHNTAYVKGVKNLIGAEVMATDIRASFSLIIAALAAKGETIINRVYHVDRGYANIVQKLQACGAQIERIKIST